MKRRLTLPRADRRNRTRKREKDRERQPGADSSDRPALTSTPSVERRRRRRHRHRLRATTTKTTATTTTTTATVMSTKTTTTTTNVRILLLAPPRRSGVGRVGRVTRRTPSRGAPRRLPSAPLSHSFTRCTHPHPYPRRYCHPKSPISRRVNSAIELHTRIIDGGAGVLFVRDGGRLQISRGCFPSIALRPHRAYSVRRLKFALIRACGSRIQLSDKRCREIRLYLPTTGNHSFLKFHRTTERRRAFSNETKKLVSLVQKARNNFDVCQA